MIINHACAHSRNVIEKEHCFSTTLDKVHWGGGGGGGVGVGG